MQRYYTVYKSSDFVYMYILYIWLRNQITAASAPTVTGLVFMRRFRFAWDLYLYLNENLVLRGLHSFLVITEYDDH